MFDAVLAAVALSASPYPVPAYCRFPVADTPAALGRVAKATIDNLQPKRRAQRPGGEFQFQPIDGQIQNGWEVWESYQMKSGKFRRVSGGFSFKVDSCTGAISDIALQR